MRLLKRRVDDCCRVVWVLAVREIASWTRGSVPGEIPKSNAYCSPAAIGALLTGGKMECWSGCRFLGTTLRGVSGNALRVGSRFAAGAGRLVAAETATRSPSTAGHASVSTWGGRLLTSRFHDIPLSVPYLLDRWVPSGGC